MALLWRHIDSGFRGAVKLPERDQTITITLPDGNYEDGTNKYKELPIDIHVPLSLANDRKVKLLSFEMSDSFLEKKGIPDALTRFNLSAHEGGFDGISRNDLYKNIYDLIKHYSTIEERYYHLVTCFIISSYYVDVAMSFPVIWINGENGTGKSTLGRLISLLGFYGKFVTRISTAALYRGLDFTANLLVLDEMEKMMYEATSEEIQNILTVIRSGSNYGSFVEICIPVKNGQFETYLFRIFSPKVIISINDMSDKTGALGSRLIKILMRESLKEHDDLPNKDSDYSFDFISIKDTRDALFAHRFYDLYDYLEAYNEIAKTTPMRARTWDSFKALFAVADIYGGKYFSSQEIVSHLIQCVEITNEGQQSNNSLSTELKGLMDNLETKWVGQNVWVSTISDHLLQFDDDYSDWSEEERRRKKAALGRKVKPLLNRFGFQTKRGNQGQTVFFDPESYKMIMEVYRSLKPQVVVQGGLDDFTELTAGEKEQLVKSVKKVTGITISEISSYLADKQEKEVNYIFTLDLLIEHFTKGKELTVDQVRSQETYIESAIKNMQEKGQVYHRGNGEFNLAVK